MVLPREHPPVRVAALEGLAVAPFELRGKAPGGAHSGVHYEIAGLGGDEGAGYGEGLLLGQRK